jgi:hypothetical protein
MVRSCPLDGEYSSDARANWNIRYYLPIDEYRNKRNTAPLWKETPHYGTVRDLFVHSQLDMASGGMASVSLALVEEVRTIEALGTTGYECFNTSERRTLRIIPVTCIAGAVCFLKIGLRTIIVHE